jgi:hypothetical protein
MGTVSQRFTKFLLNIQLTQKQLEDAITKHNGVRKTLHEAYYSSAYQPTVQMSAYKSALIESYSKSTIQLDEGYVYRSSLLVGSYGKNIAIAPPSDIDILFQLPGEKFDKYDNNTWNGQSQLLQNVKAILQKTYSRTDIRADGQIISVPFASYNVEVLPAFKLTNGQYYFPDTHNGGSWKTTDPKAEQKNISTSNKRSQGNTVKLIKMVKAWKYYCNVPIKSLVIELRAVNFLNSWEHYDKSATYYDWMIRDFFSELLKYVNGHCKIPGIDEKVLYGDKWESKAKSALDRSIKACDYETEDSTVSATSEWKKIFGSRFEY